MPPPSRRENSSSTALQWLDGSAQSDTILVPVPAGKSFVITAVLCTASNGNSVDVAVTLEWDAGPDLLVLEHLGIPPGGGFSHGSGSGVISRGGDGEDLLLTAADPVGGGCTITVTGHLR